MSGQLGGPVIYEARIGWDGGDQWGTTMEWWFAVAEVLYVSGEHVPAEWQFRPGVGLNRESLEDEESYPASILLDMLDSGDIDADDLRHAGNVLTRYAAQLKLAGRDY